MSDNSCSLVYLYIAILIGSYLIFSFWLDNSDTPPAEYQTLYPRCQGQPVYTHVDTGNLTLMIQTWLKHPARLTSERGKYRRETIDIFTRLCQTVQKNTSSSPNHLNWKEIFVVWWRLARFEISCCSLGLLNYRFSNHIKIPFHQISDTIKNDKYMKHTLR